MPFEGSVFRFRASPPSSHLLQRVRRVRPLAATGFGTKYNLFQLGVRRWSTTVDNRTVRSYASSQAQPSPLHDLLQRTKAQKTLIFHSDSDDPYHNLAIEHFILTNSDPESRILFLYTNRPCVVIGRNQNPWTECNLQLVQQGLDGKPIDLVRRRSGGGTVFHDEGNLNFSVIVPNNKDFTRRMHAELVVNALNNIHSITTEYDGPENIWVNDRHDITMATLQNKGRTEFKVSGSAFKLTRGRALHHGTILHSSPHLENISPLLRSPGRSYVRAKGVESVRSPVMNIFNVHDAAERKQLKAQIVNEVAREFLTFYNARANIEMVGDTDCQPDINPSIASGIQELRSDEWRFEQTPRFDFEGKVVGARQVTFSVKDGLLEQPRLGLYGQLNEEKSILQTRKEQKFYRISDWHDVFDDGEVDDGHIAAITQVFPSLQKLLHSHVPSAPTGNEGAAEQHSSNRITRQRPDGTIEQETGQNTVEVVSR